jgi:predicted outer membrane protein
MQRRTSRNLSRAVIVAVVLAVGATIWQSWTAGTPGMSGVVQTSWGPLSPADRDLLVKVRLACLWEVSTGQQMQQQASSPAVKEAGRKITLEHTELDQKVRDVADKLGVLLPSTPSAQQIAWMNEISAQTGSEYDRVAVHRLREAHGIVLPLLAQVRVGTRNDLVRAHAIDTTAYVNRHLGYLEGTGLVNHMALPDTPSPGLLSGSVGWTDLIVPGLVLIACLLVAVGLGTTLRGRSAARKASAAAAPPMVTTPGPQVATAQSLLALPQAPVRIREVPDDDAPTGSFPRVDSDSGSFAAPSPAPRPPAPMSPAVGFPAVPDRRVPAATATGANRVSTTGGYSTGARIATLGAPAPRTPGQGLPHTEAHADVLTRGVTDTGPRHAVRR